MNQEYSKLKCQPANWSIDSTKKENQITTSRTTFDPVIYGNTIAWEGRKWEAKRNSRETDDIYMCNIDLSFSSNCTF